METITNTIVIKLGIDVYKKGEIIHMGKSKTPYIITKEPNGFYSFLKKLFKVKHPYKYELQNNMEHPDCFTATIIDFLLK